MFSALGLGNNVVLSAIHMQFLNNLIKVSQCLYVDYRDLASSRLSEQVYFWWDELVPIENTAKLFFLRWKEEAGKAWMEGGEIKIMFKYIAKVGVKILLEVFSGE